VYLEMGTPACLKQDYHYRTKAESTGTSKS
jgi:hypothetical protein